MSAEAEKPNTWTGPQRIFIDWLALPKAMRQPRTQKELCQKFGVGEGTLSEWKRLPGFMDEVARVAKEFMKDDVADVLGAIRSSAKKGSIAHINMFLSMTGLAADVEAAGKGPIGDSDAARSRLFAELTRRVAAAQPAGTTGGARSPDPE